MFLDLWFVSWVTEKLLGPKQLKRLEQNFAVNRVVGGSSQEAWLLCLLLLPRSLDNSMLFMM